MRISDWSSDVCSSDLRFDRSLGCLLGSRRARNDRSGSRKQNSHINTSLFVRLRYSQRQRQRADGDAATLEHALGFRHVTYADRGCRTRPALEQIASLAHSAVADGVAIPVDRGNAAMMDVKHVGIGGRSEETTSEPKSLTPTYNHV